MRKLFDTLLDLSPKQFWRFVAYPSLWITGFLGLLKLGEIITWSWFWVLAPLGIPVLFIFTVIIISAIQFRHF